MPIVPEWAPSIHPMLVHFPIAILSLAIVLDLVLFFLRGSQKWWSDNATITLYVVGALSAVVVYLTGESAADSVFLPAEAQSVLNEHADWALWTVWFYGLYAVTRIVAVRTVPTKHFRKYRLVFFSLSLVGFFLLYQTGDHGAQMVFKHGVGVQAVDADNANPSGADQNDVTGNEKPSQPGADSFIRQDQGDWTWKIKKHAVQTLQEQFHFLTANPDQVNAEAVPVDDDSYALQFSGDQLKGFFVTHDSYQNVQVDYYLDMASFNGVVTLANHVQGISDYDYVSISSDGTVEQGRLQDGRRIVFEVGSADVSNPIFVRVVANGTHFRGYVDKQMVVHGHGEAPRPGSVGLKFEGDGSLLLEHMELVQLKGG